MANAAPGVKEILTIGKFLWEVRERSYDLSTHRHRFLLVDAPLSPMRTGRQPSRDDRDPAWQDL